MQPEDRDAKAHAIATYFEDLHRRVELLPRLNQGGYPGEALLLCCCRIESLGGSLYWPEESAAKALLWFCGTTAGRKLSGTFTPNTWSSLFMRASPSCTALSESSRPGSCPSSPQQRHTSWQRGSCSRFRVTLPTTLSHPGGGETHLGHLELLVWLRFQGRVIPGVWMRTTKRAWPSRAVETDAKGRGAAQRHDRGRLRGSSMKDS